MHLGKLEINETETSLPVIPYEECLSVFKELSHIAILTQTSL
jgi:hypothetical protein